MDISYFDALRFQFGDAPAEQKLAVLRAESVRWLSTIHGYGTLIQRKVGQPETLERLDELVKWSAVVVDATETMRNLIDALAAPQKREERGIPELRPYDNLLDAVRQTAHKLNLPLAELLDDTSKVFIHSQYPLVLLDEPRYHREIHFALIETGYSVELLSFTDERIFQVEQEIFPSSLEDAAIAIGRRLIEHWTTNEIQQNYGPSNSNA